MRIRSVLSAACLVASLPVVSHATLISGSWDFSATVGATTFSGTFTFAGLDSTQSYINSTAAGFSVTTNFDTSGGGGNAFSYDGGNLRIGGLTLGVDAAGSGGDWILFTPDFGTGQLAYYVPGGGSVSSNSVSVSPTQQVPEPGSLALVVAAVLAGIQARRPRA